MGLELRKGSLKTARESNLFCRLLKIRMVSVFLEGCKKQKKRREKGKKTMESGEMQETIHGQHSLKYLFSEPSQKRFTDPHVKEKQTY